MKNLKSNNREHLIGVLGKIYPPPPPPHKQTQKNQPRI